MEDIIQLAREICPELLSLLAAKYPEYLVNYKMKCEEYLSDKYSNTQRLAAANDVLFMARHIGLLDITAPKTITVCFRATQAEKEKLEREAREQGLSISDYIRGKLTL